MAEKRMWRESEKEGYGMTARSRMHKNRSRSSSEAGQVLVLVTLALFVLIGILALATDVGFLRYMRRNMQKAADAGAIGGATEHIYDPPNVVFGARRDASQNGFTHDQDGVIVTVNNPPLSGPHKDLPDADQYVEVIVEQDQPTFFARIFNITSAKVSARAVAYGGLKSGPGTGCIYALSPDADAAFHVSGQYTSVTANCNIIVDSASDNAFLATGNSTVSSTGISVHGGSYIGGDTTVVDPPPTDNAAVVGDPLSADPDFIAAQNDINSKVSAPCDYTNFRVPQDAALDNTGTYVLTGGKKYCGGITFTASNLNVKFGDGLYIIYGGGIDMHSGGSTLTGENLTFYNTGTDGGQYNYGSITINAGANTSLSATEPGGTSVNGSVPTMLFWQDSNNTKNATFNGNSTTELNGYLYFPSANVTMDGGNATDSDYTVIIAQQVKFAGNATFTLNNPMTSGTGDSGTTPPIPKVVLVE